MGRIARESHAGEGGVFGEALLLTQRSGQSGLLLFVQSSYCAGAQRRGLESVVRVATGVLPVGNT